MSKLRSEYKCRICTSDKIENFRLNHFVFSTKNENWKSFLCYDCGGVSDFRIAGISKRYDDGSYRKKETLSIDEDQNSNVIPPVNSWSEITFKRWSNIWKLLTTKTEIFNKDNLKMLDFGGYNGYLPYAFKQKHKINSFVADYDPNGLAMADFLGSKTIDLSKQELLEKDFDLITAVQVFEHLEKPKDQLIKLKNILSVEGIIYVEVPNLYGFPLGDEMHNSTFTQFSLYKLFTDCGFEIINYGFTQTPKESIKFNYYLNNKKECIYIIASLKKNLKITKIPEANIPKNTRIFKYRLQVAYARIMLNSVSLVLFKLSLKNLKTFFLFLIYGLTELITLKILRFSLINKIFRKK